MLVGPPSSRGGRIDCQLRSASLWRRQRDADGVGATLQKKVPVLETGLLICSKTNCRRHFLERASARSHRPGPAYPGPAYPDLALLDQDLPARDFLDPVYPDPGFPDRGCLDRDHIAHLGRDCPDHIADRYSSRDLSIISTTPNAPSLRTNWRNKASFPSSANYAPSVFAEGHKPDRRGCPVG